MKKFLTGLGLVLLSQQALAVTSVVGIDFLDVAHSVTSSVGDFVSNDGNQGVNSVADGNAAAYAYGTSAPSTVDVALGNAWNIGEVGLTLLFVGSDAHTGEFSLTGGSIGSSSTQQFSLTPYDGTNWTGYTGFNSVSANPTTGQPATYGIFALNIDLAAAFPGLTGSFDGVHLNIYDGSGGSNDAAVSLIGTTASAVVPVPAAVWLFGSGLLALVGFNRRLA
jgi:hypothetical protein